MKIHQILLAAILVCNITTASAQVMERCFQAALVHKSDCKTNNSPEDCAAPLIDVEPEYWIYVPKGLCTKLVGDQNLDPTMAND